MNNDSHELVAAIKELAIELGRTPTRNEFCSRVSRHKLDMLFGTYTALLHAAGLEPLSQSRAIKKIITNEVFEKDIGEHLDQYKPKDVSRSLIYPKIAVISDAHFPFENKLVVEMFYKFVRDFNPEIVIANGDMVDFYSFSRFPRSHNIFTPREETTMSREKHENFWKEITKISPGSKKLNMLGNHCIRPMKQMLEHFPVAEDWINEALKKQFTFEGVETIYDPTEEYMLPGDIMVHHGYRSKLGEHRDYSLYNSIVGHTHQGGVVYKKIRGQTLWELNSGFAGDPDSKGLSYRPQRITTWTPGFGAVDQYGPRFIPYN